MTTPSPSTVVLKLTAKSVATTTIVVALLTGIVMRAMVSGYSLAGGAAGMAKMAHLLNNPAIRALYGVAYSVSSPGGFAVWRVSSFLALGVAIWAALAGTKVTRGAEDDAMVDLVLAQPVTRVRFVVVTSVGLGGASLLIGAFAAVTLATAAPLSGSVLFGAGLALVAMVYCAIGVLCAQVFAPRRRASEMAMAAVGLSFAVRMVVDAAAPTSAWRVASPLLWFESLRTFASSEPLWLIALGCLVVATTSVSVVLFRRRDLGSSVLAANERPPRRPMPRSAVAVTWRLRRAEALIWIIGCALIGAMMGTITGPISDFARTDPNYAAMLERAGYGSLLSIKGFVAEIAVMFALLSSLVFVAQLTSLFHDERDGRLDVILATGPTRRTWLSAVAGVGVVTWTCIAASFAVGLVVGAQLSGSSLTLVDAAKAMCNVAPVVVVIAAVGFCVHGIWPAAATIATSTLIALIAVITVVGPLLHWPNFVLALSPLHHLALVPANPVALLPLVLMGALAVVVFVAGVAFYERRDLT